MQSLLGEDNKAHAGPDGEGSMSLDPSSFVDTAGWANELNSGSVQKAQTPLRPGARRTAPPANKSKVMAAPGGGEVESLEQMLEPERTGVHKKADGKIPWAIIIAVIIILAAGATIAAVVL